MVHLNLPLPVRPRRYPEKVDNLQDHFNILVSLGLLAHLRFGSVVGVGARGVCAHRT